jgi:DNA polymerase III alpha subunit (gram-positive type)
MKYIAFDVESGGTTNDMSLLSVYFVVLGEDLKTIYGELDLKIKPNDGIYHVTAEALDVNKINLVEHDKEAITEGKASTLLYEFLEKHAPSGSTKLTPLGHGIAHDIIFIKQHLTKNFNKFVSYKYLDTGCVVQFLKLIGKVPRDLGGSLKELAEYFDVDICVLHSAKDDTLLTIEVLKKICNLF